LEGGYGVTALAVSGSNVYAGGYFTIAGGNPANYIAKWDGGSWSALGAGMSNSQPLALVASGSDLYAGGYFNGAGGNPANYIAKWNGTSWTALGSGMDNYVRGLAVLGADLYAGGDFTAAGGKVSAYIARAYLFPLPTLSVLRSGLEVKAEWPSSNTSGFVLEHVHTLTAPMSWVSNSASVSDDGTNKWVTQPATNGSQFFRLRRP
jgi:hypothetical protein